MTTVNLGREEEKEKKRGAQPFLRVPTARMEMWGRKKKESGEKDCEQFPRKKKGKRGEEITSVRRIVRGQRLYPQEEGEGKKGEKKKKNNGGGGNKR